MGQPDFLRHLQGPVERGQSTRWYINLAYLMATELTEDQPFFTMVSTSVLPSEVNSKPSNAAEHLQAIPREMAR